MAADQTSEQPARTAPGRRVRNAPSLLGASLGLAVVAILLVAASSYFTQARAARPLIPTPTPGIYLMTEGALEMEMTPLSADTPSAAQLARVAGIARLAKHATAQYQDISAAISAGYQTSPALLVDTQGQHYFQPQYLGEADAGRFDPVHPPFLVYNTVKGRAVLSGLLYYLPASMTRRQLAAIFPPSLAAWHRHINVCIGGGTSLLDGTAVLPVHDRATCTGRGGAFLARTGWMVHLWWDQPIGRSLFAMDRPRR